MEVSKKIVFIKDWILNYVNSMPVKAQSLVIGISGGIDSSVAAVLAHRAVGSLLHCVYVDTGFMRKNESSEVKEMFAPEA